MSRQYRRRQTTTQAPLTIDAHDYSAAQTMIDPDTQYIYDGFVNGTMALNYSPAFPIQVESYHPMADVAAQLNPAATSTDRIYDETHRNLGGVMGEINPAYATGVVSSDAVENFNLDGKTQIIRRGRNPSDRGPVGTSDHSALLGLAYAQQVNQYFPNEESQSDLVRSV